MSSSHRPSRKSVLTVAIEFTGNRCLGGIAPQMYNMPVVQKKAPEELYTETRPVILFPEIQDIDLDPHNYKENDQQNDQHSGQSL